MSVFNRVVVVIIGVVVLALAVTTLLVAAGMSTPEVLPYGWFESQLQKVADATGASVIGIIAVSVVIALGMIAMLFFEFVPLRTPGPLLISSTEEGSITIDAESICILAESIAATIHSVHQVKCRIREGAGGLLISCRVLVALATNIPEVGIELQIKIKEAVEQFTGLAVAQVDMQVKYKPVEARRLAVR